MVDSSMPLEDFLRLRHAEIPLYVISLHASEKGLRQDPESAEARELLRQHFLYWWKLEEAGNLLGAGPVGLGTPDQFGMALVRADSLEQAVSLAEHEPFHVAGWRINTVRKWNLNEGLAVPFVKSL